MKVWVVGAGTYGDVLTSYMRHEVRSLDPTGLVDDDPTKHGTERCGLPVLGGTELLREAKSRGVEGVVVTLGDPTLRLRFLRMARELGLATPHLIHPSAVVSPDAVLGQTVTVMAMSVVSPFATLGDGVMVAPQSIVGHHTTLGEGTFLAYKVGVGGSIEIGKRCYFGAACTIMTGVKRVGDDVTVGAGALVIRDVDAGLTVVGLPAKPLIKRTGA